MKMDAVFYRVFQVLPTLPLELAGIPVTAPYAFHSEEVKQTAFRLDGVLLPVNAPDAPVVVVEVQCQPDEEFYGRLFAELFLYLYRSTPVRPWQVVVLYPDRSVERLDDRYTALLAAPNVHRIYLEDWRERPAHSLDQALLHLLVMEPDTLEPAATALAERLHAPGVPGTLPVSQWLDLIEMVLVYRLPTLNRQEIQTMLGLTQINLTQSRFYQEVFAEGEIQGEAKGEIKGEIKAKAETLKRLLTRRFGRLPKWAAARIDGADQPQLDRWLDVIFDAGTLEGLLGPRPARRRA